ncbi:MAG: hypothetical protein K6G09_01220 [Treponema sp.]|nr:hypothetical protein [Treponema sp.]
MKRELLSECVTTDMVVIPKVK